MLSIVIPTFNRYKRLSLLLNSLGVAIKQMNGTFDVEIIVIDDGSEDQTKNMTTNEMYYIYHQNNNGAASARNKGVELAQYDYILFIDDDCEVPFDYFLFKMQRKLRLYDIVYGPIQASKRTRGLIGEYLKDKFSFLYTS